MMIRAVMLKPVRRLLWLALLACPVAVAAGSASAFFLWALDVVTHWHWAHPMALLALPLAGLLVGLVYHHVGKGADKGSNLIIDEIHETGGMVPTRMAPLVLLGTLMTHAFGGSAGREGTAVQMGGGLAGGLALLFRVGSETRRVMLMCGVAAGFGSVFGTPLAGAIFAIEVLVIGRIQYDALVPVLLAAVLGDAVCTAWGAHHTMYDLDVAPGAGLRALFDGMLLLKVALAGCVFGLMGRGFAGLTHGLQQGFAKLSPYAPLRPLMGGCVVIALVYLLGTREYLGLGVEAGPAGGTSILSSFEAEGAQPWDWLGKTVFTAVTLGSGFKGGEVTPLFYIGSTLGHWVGGLLNEPTALFAALGFLAVFAGASNTPLACTLMGVELFGAHHAVSFTVVCFLAYQCSGNRGIYLAQQIAVKKGERQLHSDPKVRP
jgi:H+/Cl- antiporter ClcA